jgi:hypothetical protein
MAVPFGVPSPSEANTVVEYPLSARTTGHPPPKAGDAGDRPTHDQGVHLVGADALQVVGVSQRRVFDLGAELSASFTSSRGKVAVAYQPAM